MEVVPAETMERMREAHSLRRVTWGVSPAPGGVVAGLAIYVQPAQAVEVAGWYVAPRSSVAQSHAGVRKTEGLEGLLRAASKTTSRMGGESTSQTKAVG